MICNASSIYWDCETCAFHSLLTTILSLGTKWDWHNYLSTERKKNFPRQMEWTTFAIEGNCFFSSAAGRRPGAQQKVLEGSHCLGGCWNLCVLYWKKQQRVSVLQVGIYKVCRYRSLDTKWVYRRSNQARHGHLQTMAGLELFQLVGRLCLANHRCACGCSFVIIRHQSRFEFALVAGADSTARATQTWIIFIATILKHASSHFGIW